MAVQLAAARSAVLQTTSDVEFRAAHVIDKSEVYGHRGAGVSDVGGDACVPENSLEACAQAVKAGLSAVELDVWLTADNEVVVVHGSGGDAEGFLASTVLCHDLTRTTELCKGSSLLHTACSNDQAFAPETEAEGGNVEAVQDANGLPSISPLTQLRIENISYWDMKKKGLLKLRQPWSCHKQGLVSSATASTEASRNLAFDGEVNGATDQSADEMSRVSCKIENKCQFLETDPVLVKKSGDCSDFDENVYMARGDAYVNNAGETEDLPLLSDILQRFYTKLTFNIELKGTNPRVGLEVLRFARQYPGAITRISSFMWVPDHEEVDAGSLHTLLSSPGKKCSSYDLVTKEGQNVVHKECLEKEDLHNLPNGRVPCDLLEPLRHNAEGVPLALLFGISSKLPSVQRILACMEKYNATWAHVPHVSYVLYASHLFERYLCFAF